MLHFELECGARRKVIELTLHNLRQKHSERPFKELDEQALDDMLHLAHKLKALPPKLNDQIDYQSQTKTYVDNLFTEPEHNKGLYRLNHYQGQTK